MGERYFLPPLCNYVCKLYYDIRLHCLYLNVKANGRTNVNIKDLARRLDSNYKVRPVRRNYTEDEKKLVEEGVEDDGLTFQEILERNPEHFENRSSQDLRLCYRSIYNKKARRAGRSSVI